MSYVIAAYTVSLGSIALYALHLGRERARLREALVLERKELRIPGGNNSRQD